MYRHYLKRALDIALALPTAIVLLPLLALVAAAIRLEDKGPALFRQRRVGRDGRPFTLLKFRSMPLNSGDVPRAQAVALKVTRVGRWIRRTNIDELPQLFNILAGDMSVVGPRPVLPSQEVVVKIRTANGAIACRPGLTGLAQINSYTGMPETEKAAWDGKYAAEVTLARDLGIILRTFLYLMKPPPVY